MTKSEFLANATLGCLLGERGAQLEELRKGIELLVGRINNCFLHETIEPMGGKHVLIVDS